MGRGAGNPISSWRAAVSPNTSFQRDTSTFHSRSHSSDPDSGAAPIGGRADNDPSSARFTGVVHFRHHSNQTPGDCKPNLPRNTPYIPPRQHQSVTPQVCPHPVPHATYSHDPPGYQGSVQTHSYEGEKSITSDSHPSAGSSHRTNSTASSSDYSITHKGHCDPPHSQSPLEYTQQQVPLPHPTSQRQPYCHYSAHQGQHRVGLETVNRGDRLPNTLSTHCFHAIFPGYPLSDVPSPETFDQLHPHKHPSSQMDYIPSHNSDSLSSAATLLQGSAPTFSVPPLATTSLTGRSLFPDAGPYLRQQLGLKPHEPVSLWSLPDPPPGEKPNQPYPTLIKLAIYGSPNKQLTLQEIYSELERRFTWFREHRKERAWRNSIRHNLSLNKVFRPVPRPITDPGKGSYWQLDVSGGEGYKRPRKRRSRASKATPSDDDDEEDTSELDDDTDGSLEMRPQSVHSCPPQHSVALLQSTSGSRLPTDNTAIDPELRGDSGHLVGEGRSRPGSRRTNSAGIPYPNVTSSSRNLYPTTLSNLDLSSYSQPGWSSQSSSFVQTTLQPGEAHRQGSGRASSVPVPTNYDYPLSVSGVSREQISPQSTSNVPAIHRPSPGPGLEYRGEPGQSMTNAQLMQSHEGQALSVSSTHGRSRVHPRLPSSQEPSFPSPTPSTSTLPELSLQRRSSTVKSKGKGRAI